MEKQSETFVGTFLNRLKEQSFTIILLVGIMYYQNAIFTQQLQEYKKVVDEKEKLILQMANDELQRLIEREKYLVNQRDGFIEDLQRRLNEKMVVDQKPK